MFQKLKQMGDMAKMAKQMRDFQKELEKEEIVVEEQGIKIVMKAGVVPQIKSFTVNGISNEVVVSVLNKAIKKTQEETAQKMVQMQGGMGNVMKGLMGS